MTVPAQRGEQMQPTDVTLGEVYRGLIGLNATVASLAGQLSAFITQSRSDNEARDARLAQQFVPRESITLMAKECADDRDELKSEVRLLRVEAAQAVKDRKRDRQWALTTVIAILSCGGVEQVLVHAIK